MGRVVSCEDKLVIQALRRPGAANVAFGRYMTNEEEPQPLEEMIFEWATVVAEDWRSVP